MVCTEQHGWQTALVCDHQVSVLPLDRTSEGEQPMVIVYE